MRTFLFVMAALCFLWGTMRFIAEGLEKGNTWINAAVIFFCAGAIVQAINKLNQQKS